MARVLVERGVRFVQLYHRGWDVPAIYRMRPDSAADHVDKRVTRWFRI